MNPNDDGEIEPLDDRIRIILINRRLTRIRGNLMKLVAWTEEVQLELSGVYAQAIRDDEFEEQRIAEWVAAYRNKKKQNT